MSTVHLDDEEWQRVLAIIATAPWNAANPLLMKIGEQLRNQTKLNPNHTTNSGEVPARTPDH
jgi:hypothetical protein